MKQLLNGFLICVICFTNTNCNTTIKKQNRTNPVVDTILKPKYAKGFWISQENKKRLLHINNTNGTLTYQLISDSISELPSNSIRIPVLKTIASSTTDIPFFEALKITECLIGFSETNYISSKKTRKRIEDKKIKDVGKMTQLNTELILELQPQLFISSSPAVSNKNLSFIEQHHITVIQNTSWLETHPLGRAEWIKFFGYLFDKQNKSDSIFNNIEKQYNKLKKIATKTTLKPTILSGNLYKDVWYAPAGDSFEAKLIKDANATYLWENTKGTGSLSLSIETVLEKGLNADIWLGGGQFTTREKLGGFEKKYTLFEAFKNNKVYTKDVFKGATGGIWYFEVGSLRPDWILEDLIRILHPHLLEDKPFHFYQKLD